MHPKCSWEDRSDGAPHKDTLRLPTFLASAVKYPGPVAGSPVQIFPVPAEDSGLRCRSGLNAGCSNFQVGRSVSASTGSALELAGIPQKASPQKSRFGSLCPPLSIRLNGWAGADQVAVSIGVVDSIDRWPEFLVLHSWQGISCDFSTVGMSPYLSG